MRLDHLLSMEKRGETHKNPMVRITSRLLNALFNFEDPQRKLNRDVPNVVRKKIEMQQESCG